MQVEELDSLAEWFKKNVLEISKANDGFDELNTFEEAYSERSDASKARSSRAQVNEQDDELSLIEFIIGINEVEV